MGERRKAILSPEEAAQLIPSGGTVTVSSSAAQLVPDKVLAGIEARFLATGEPKGLTMVFPVAVGDSFGTVGMDHLAYPGLIKRLIGGSYVNGPASKPAPKIYAMILGDQVEAYNLPLGVLMHLHRDIAAKKPGVITKIGLGTFVDPRDRGGRMNDVTPPDLIEVVQLRGEEWLLFRAFPIDVAIIRGTTADVNGNITTEHEGVTLAVLAQATAAHNSGGKVIAQVKRVVAAGTLDPQKVKVPGILVDALVVDPEQRQNTGIAYDPAISGEIRAAAFPVEPVPLGPEKAIARRALMQIRPGDIVNLGFGISSLVPQIAFEEGVFDRLNFTVEQGAVGGLPLTGFAFGASHNPEAIIDSPAQFDLIDGGGVTVGCLAFAEVDGSGNVNVTRLKAQPHVLAGAGGFINIAMGTRKLVYCGTLMAGGLDIRIEAGSVHIAQDGRFQKFVARVQDVTFNGRLAAMERYYEDMQVGEEYESPARTITETDVVNFSAFSGDWSPVHSDEEWCKQTPFKTRIGHGLLGLALTEGLKFRIPEFSTAKYMASLYWNYKFMAPILIGDTLRLKVKVQSKRETKKPDRGIVVEYVTMLNQRDEVVGEGEHGLMIYRRRQA